jgi:hypothetical protein
VVAIAGGVTAFVLTRGSGGDTTPTVPTPTGPSVPVATTEPSQTPVPDKTFRSSRYGFTLELPGSIQMNEDSNTGGAAGTGFLDGFEIAVVVLPSAPFTDPDAVANAVMSAMGGSARLIEKRTRVIRGDDVISIIYEVPGQGRLESCLIPGSQSFVVTLAAKPDEFDKLAAFRDSLFRDRFKAHAP